MIQLLRNCFQIATFRRDASFCVGESFLRQVSAAGCCTMSTQAAGIAWSGRRQLSLSRMAAASPMITLLCYLLCGDSPEKSRGAFPNEPPPRVAALRQLWPRDSLGRGDAEMLNGCGEQVKTAYAAYCFYIATFLRNASFCMGEGLNDSLFWWISYS